MNYSDGEHRGIGRQARPSDLPAEPPCRHESSTVELINAVLRHAFVKARVSIPVLFHEEGVHGYSAFRATHFPQPIALARS